MVSTNHKLSCGHYSIANCTIYYTGIIEDKPSKLQDTKKRKEKKLKTNI